MLILSVNEREGSGTVTPLTPSPRSEIKGIRLFRVISRKLTRKSRNREVNSDESSNSDSSSSSASSGHHTSRSHNKERSLSPNHTMSSSSSDSGSDVQTMRGRHTSAESLRKVFQNLNLSGTDTKEAKKKKEKKAQKSILRHPTSYTYVKGLSGLPTQRIPIRHQPRDCNASCSCSMHYFSGLNR